MQLRKQVLARFVSLPILFGVVVVSSLVLVQQVRDELLGVAYFHLPIAQLVADLDVATGEYELRVSRLLSAPAPSADDAREAAELLAETGRRIEHDLHETTRLLDEAVADPMNGVDDRLVLARTRGTLDLVSRSIDSFLAVGEASLAAWKEGDHDEARRVAEGFVKFESSINPDLARMRAALSRLENDSVAVVHDRLMTLRIVNASLFVLAAVLGLWLGFDFASRVANRLRLLIGAAQQVAGGSYDVALPPSTNDEVGELTDAFAGLVTCLRKEAKTNDTFGHFFDPRIINHVLASGGAGGEHAERRTVSVLFADIHGFTGLAETLTAESLVRLLNRVFSSAAQTIQARGGIVDKYIGDAVMAFFMPPFSPGDSHAAACCLAALDHQRALRALGPELASLLGLRRGAPDIEMRVGIATGEVLIGTVGSPTARSFPAIGDAVNAASRLTGVNKVYGTTVLITGDTFRLARGEIEAREIDEVVVSGKSEPVALYEVMAPAGGLSAEDAERCDSYAKALAAYRARDFECAERGFAECLRLRADDGPARVLHERAALLRADPPPENWDSVFYLTSK